MALQTRTIERLGRAVTRLGLGALPMGPLQRGLTPKEGGRVIRHALEQGITFVDTATVYGTYEHVAAGIKGWNGPLTVSTKTHARDDAKVAREHIDKALRELGRDGIDIMLCHCARSLPTPELWGPTLEELTKAKDRGDIRLIGMSSHTIEGVRMATANPELEVIHPLINLIGLGIIDGTADEMAAAIRDAKAAGKFIYAMKSLAGGNLVKDREAALRYVMGIDEIDVITMGVVSTQEVDWNIRFFCGEAIPQSLADTTAAHSKRLNILEFICKGCGQCVEHCENDALRLEDGVAKVDPAQCILCGYCAPRCPEFAIRMV